VTLICDSGELYRDTYYSPEWLTEHGYDLSPSRAVLEQLWNTGQTGQFSA
jgi:cysteine synthase A